MPNYLGLLEQETTLKYFFSIRDGFIGDGTVVAGENHWLSESHWQTIYHIRFY